MGYASDPALPVPTVAVTLNAADGRILASSSTQIDRVALPRDEAGWSVLIGPEGGFSPEELDSVTRALGPLTVETLSEGEWAAAALRLN